MLVEPSRLATCWADLDLVSVSSPAGEVVIVSDLHIGVEAALAKLERIAAGHREVFAALRSLIGDCPLLLSLPWSGEGRRSTGR